MFERSLPEGLEAVVTNIEIPWSIAFSPEGEMYFTEREGRLSVLKGDEVKILHEFEVEAGKGDEGGLLGLDFHPDYPKTSFLYLYYTYRDVKGVWNRIARYRLDNDKLFDEENKHHVTEISKFSYLM